MPKERKQYEDFEIEFELRGNTRKELRDSVIKKFLEEKSGYWESGIKNVTRYKYIVERLSDGRRIFLVRPTFLNKGIDFQVWVEKFDGFKDDKPSHKDIFKDLKLKQKESHRLLEKLIEAIDYVWLCEEPDDVIRKNVNLSFASGFSVEMLKY